MPDTRLSQIRPPPVNHTRATQAMPQSEVHQAKAPTKTAAISTSARVMLLPTLLRPRLAKTAPKAITVSGLNTVMKKLELRKRRVVR